VSTAGSLADAATSILKQDDPSQVDWWQQRLEGDRKDRSQSMFENLKGHKLGRHP
jgi:hypothetical protein